MFTSSCHFSALDSEDFLKKSEVGEVTRVGIEKLN